MDNNTLKPHFAFKDYEKAASFPETIITGSNYRITILSDILIRLEFSPTGTFEDRPTQRVLFRRFNVPQFVKKEDENFVTVTTSYFRLEYKKNAPFYGPKISPEQNLKIILNDTDKIWFFGAAEARNFKGTALSLDDNNGSVDYQKGLYSTDGYVSIDDSESLIFNKDGSLGKRNDKRIDTYVFLYKKDFGFCLRDYFILTGKPALIPRYALGVWWNKNVGYTTKQIQDLIENFKRYEIPLSIFLFGPLWHIIYPDTYSGFTFNYDLINNPKAVIDYLHANKIRVGLNVDPTGGIHPDEIAYQRYKTASGYNEEGIIPFNVFSKAMINAYFTELIKPLYDLGTDFFWVDYANIKNPLTLWTLNYYHFNDFKQFNNKRPLILARNSGVAAHRYPVMYSGETFVSWDNLDLFPEFNSTSSNIGLSWWSHDIGGYKGGVEDPELYMRYVQLGTYSPILRLSSDASHYYKREPWLWESKIYSIVKDYLKLRHRLIPYIYTEAYKYSKTGLPLIQPVYYRYPEIYDEVEYKNEYYFGSELFIAPITNKKDLIMNRTVHHMFLPNGIWYDFKTGKKFVGGKRYVSFFKDEDYPVFAKKGTIIPMAILDNEDLNNTNPPESMEIHIFPGKSNTYKLYEDDGTTSMFNDGYYLITDIDYNYERNNFTAVIRPTDGKSGIVPAERNYKVRFRNTRKPTEVILYVGEDKQKDVKSYVDGNDFIVEVDHASTIKQISINCRGQDIEIEAERIINEDVDSIISDLLINTSLKEQIAAAIFSDAEIKDKRIAIRKLRRKGLSYKHINMFIKLLEYIAEI